MASATSNNAPQEIVHAGGLGKSTLIGNLQSSIPMPSGATPPPPSRQPVPTQGSAKAPD
jgi:hypothetical protein